MVAQGSTHFKRYNSRKKKTDTNKATVGKTSVASSALLAMLFI